MKDLNLFGGSGYLTIEQRKQPLAHNCDTFWFKTNVDLSQVIQVIPFGFNGLNKEFTISQYSRDVASFMCWWTNNIHKDLNGFTGFNNIEFQLIGFTIIP